MNITMQETRRGSEDGFKVSVFSKGVVYFDVAHTLAAHFLNKKWARPATLQDMDDQLERAKEAV
jgi:hypothetical protein